MKNEIAKVEPVLTDVDFKKTHNSVIRFVKNTLRETKTGMDGDYGVIPGTSRKSLLKPGAEKLAKLFGLAATFTEMERVEDWKEDFVFYKYKCTLTHFETGKIAAEAIRSCNSKERKHASKNVYDVANTIQAVAQKRALVAAVVQATMASEIFDIGESLEDVTPPHSSVTKDEDPKRIKVLAGFFASGEERGFSEDALKNVAYAKLKVDSLKDISTSDISRLQDAILATYKLNPASGKPEKIEKAEWVGAGSGYVDQNGSHPYPPADSKVGQSSPDDTVSPETTESEPLPWEQPTSGPVAESGENDIVEGEIEEKEENPVPYFCKGSKHHPADKEKGIESTMVQTSLEEPWCSEECQEEHYPKRRDPSERPWEKGFKAK